MDDEVSAILLAGDQVEVALMDCTNAIMGLRFPEVSTDGVEKALKAHALGIEKALKAHAKQMASISRTDERIPALLAQLIEIMGKEEPKEEEDGPMEFKIVRDSGGFMSSVVVKPYVEPVKKPSGTTYN